jgi:hypothetical protein
MFLILSTQERNRTCTTSQHHEEFFMDLSRPGKHHTVVIGLFPFTCENPEIDSGQVLIRFTSGKDGLLGQNIPLTVPSEIDHSRTI